MTMPADPYQAGLNMFDPDAESAKVCPWADKTPQREEFFRGWSKARGLWHVARIKAKKELDAPAASGYIELQDQEQTTSTEKDHMKITSVTVGKGVTAKVGDNYVKANYELTATVEENEDADVVTQGLRATVNHLVSKELGLVTGDAEAAQVVPTAPAAPAAPAVPAVPAAPAAPAVPAVPAAPAAPVDPLANVVAIPAAPVMSAEDFTNAVIKFMETSTAGPETVGKTLATFNVDRVPNVPAEKRQEFLTALGS